LPSPDLLPLDLVQRDRASARVCVCHWTATLAPKVSWGQWWLYGNGVAWLVVACSCRYCCREEEQDSSGILGVAIWTRGTEEWKGKSGVVVVEFFAEGLSKIQYKCSRAITYNDGDDWRWGRELSASDNHLSESVCVCERFRMSPVLLQEGEGIVSVWEKRKSLGCDDRTDHRVISLYSLPWLQDRYRDC
jgi:hypothetical protein